jgi:hypothetical protein
MTQTEVKRGEEVLIEDTKWSSEIIPQSRKKSLIQLQHLLSWKQSLQAYNNHSNGLNTTIIRSPTQLLFVMPIITSINHDS